MGIAFGQTGILRRIEAGIHTSEDREMTARGEGQVAFVPEAFPVFCVRRQNFIQNLGHFRASRFNKTVLDMRKIGLWGAWAPHSQFWPSQRRRETLHPKDGICAATSALKRCACFPKPAREAAARQSQ